MLSIFSGRQQQQGYGECSKYDRFFLCRSSARRIYLTEEENVLAHQVQHGGTGWWLE